MRTAAKEKALALLELETRLTLSERDFARFAQALDSSFSPNAPLKVALKQARRQVERL